MNLAYVVRRLTYGALSLVILSVIIFICTNLLPGDAAVAILGENAAPEALQAIRDRLGFERPLPVQYGAWIAGVVRGDLGVSTTLNQPVGDLIAPAFNTSLAVATLTLLIATAIAIPLGVLAALRRGRRTDAAILTGSYVGISIPEFVIGPLLILLLASPPLSLFPSSGHIPFATDPVGWVSYAALPVTTLAIVLVAHLMRQTRSGMLDVLASDYIRTARLKGLPERLVIRRHALRNGLTATITVLALDVGYLMGSIVVVEEIFAYPGLGRLVIYAVANRDLPLVQGTTLVIGAIYVLTNFLADLAHGFFNPRVGLA